MRFNAAEAYEPRRRSGLFSAVAGLSTGLYWVGCLVVGLVRLRDGWSDPGILGQVLKGWYIEALAFLGVWVLTATLSAVVSRLVRKRSDTGPARGVVLSRSNGLAFGRDRVH